MHTEVLGLPMAEPDWPAEAMACCSNSSTTVYLTEGELRMAHWDLIPGSWEHTLYFEAARALTEQRFSQLVTGCPGHRPGFFCAHPGFFGH
jgi:hypothetical protein